MTKREGFKEEEKKSNWNFPIGWVGGSPEREFSN
jgi:hypothetical protein